MLALLFGFVPYEGYCVGQFWADSSFDEQGIGGRSRQACGAERLRSHAVAGRAAGGRDPRRAVRRFHQTTFSPIDESEREREQM